LKSIPAFPSFTFVFTFLQIPPVVSPFTKGGLRGIFEISPDPSFIKRGGIGKFINDEDLKLESSVWFVIGAEAGIWRPRLPLRLGSASRTGSRLLEPMRLRSIQIPV